MWLTALLCFTSLSAPPAPLRTLDLRHAALDLRFDFDARQASGTAALTLVALRDTRELRLAAVDLRVSRVEHAGRALPFRIDGAQRQLVITLAQPATAQQELTVHVHYATGRRNDSDPNNLAGSTGLGLRWFGPTHSEPRERRQLWSSHEPGSAAHWYPLTPALDDAHGFELTATVAAPLTVLAGGRLIADTTLADGQRRFHWLDAVARTADRHGVAIGEWIDVPQQAGAIRLHNWSYPDEVQATRDSVERLPAMLAWYQELTGVPFPHPAYAQVFVQDLPWGMALPGLSIQTENMVDDHGTHADFLYLWDGLEAESLAHQWFGNLLAVRDPRQIWLSRAFAHHLDQLWVEHRMGRQEYLLWNHRGDQWTWRNDWQSGVRHAVEPAVLPDDPVAFTASNVPYVRGGLVLQMLRRHLGEATWRQVLRAYTQGYAGRSVSSADLRAVVAEVSGEELDWFFDQWVRRSAHPKFTLKTAWDAPGKSYRLTVRQQVEQEPILAEGATVAYFQGWMDIEIDTRRERIWLEPQAEQTYTFTLERQPRFLNFDFERGWIADIDYAAGDAELLALLAHSADALARFEAMSTLVGRASASPANARLRRQVEAALVAQITDLTGYWRLPFLATQQLGALLAPNPQTDRARLLPATRRALLEVVSRTGSWRRTAALTVLGLTRDPQLAPLYLRQFDDPSDRVVNAAAIALGRSGSPGAFAALSALPARPSWKNQSLISALWGLTQLADPRAETLALEALADADAAPRWTLATPVWDYRLAAADTLVAIGRADRGYPIVQQRLERALSAGDIRGVFNNVLLHSVLADPRAAAIWAPLKQHYQHDANALAAIETYRQQYEARRAAQVSP